MERHHRRRVTIYSKHHNKNIDAFVSTNTYISFAVSSKSIKSFESQFTYHEIFVKRYFFLVG